MTTLGRLTQRALNSRQIELSVLRAMCSEEAIVTIVVKLLLLVPNEVCQAPSFMAYALLFRSSIRRLLPRP